MRPRLFRENPKYITRNIRGLGWTLRVSIGGAPRYPRIYLGLFPSRDEAKRALHAFGLLLVELKCPWKAKAELYRRLGRPEPMPPRVYRRCRLCNPKHRHDPARCAGDFEYFARCKIPGNEQSAGPFPTPEEARKASRRMIRRIGAIAKAYEGCA